VKKFLFLDIDGVLNSARSVAVKIGPTPESSELVRALMKVEEPQIIGLPYVVEYSLRTVDPVCVALVNKLLDSDPDIVLVLSSSHRLYFTNEKVSRGSATHLQHLRMYLEALGVHVPTSFSITPDSHRPRGEEVESWMNMAYENGIVDDDSPYAILDDSADFGADQPLVRVNPDHGLSYADYTQVCKLLCLKEPGVILL
jgi:hypothetical protein